MFDIQSPLISTCAILSPCKKPWKPSVLESQCFVGWQTRKTTKITNTSTFALPRESKGIVRVMLNCFAHLSINKSTAVFYGLITLLYNALDATHAVIGH